MTLDDELEVTAPLEAEIAQLRARLAEAERLLMLLAVDYTENVGQPRREVREFLRPAVNGEPSLE